MLSGISGHADRNGLLRWLEGFEKKPAHVFVNHGDDESCTAFAREVTEKFSVPADAPYAGTEFDLLNGCWIRLTEPVPKKNDGKQVSLPSARRQKDAPYGDLKLAVAKLADYVETLQGHSNDEIRKLTQKILSLTE